MIDWALYNGTGRCCAEALERVYRVATLAAAAAGTPETLEIPPGRYVMRRPAELRPVPGGWVVIHGPAAYIEHPYLVDGRAPPQERARTELGWGVVAPEPKIVEVN